MIWGIFSIDGPESVASLDWSDIKTCIVTGS